MSTTFGKLLKTELKLMVRDPLVLTFVFAFPIVTMLILGRAFGSKATPGLITPTRLTGTWRLTSRW